MLLSKSKIYEMRLIKDEFSDIKKGIFVSKIIEERYYKLIHYFIPKIETYNDAIVNALVNSKENLFHYFRCCETKVKRGWLLYAITVCEKEDKSYDRLKNFIYKFYKN